MEKIKALFMRIAPEPGVKDLPQGQVAISHYFVNEKMKRRRMHGMIYKIVTEHGSIYRGIRFDPKLKSGRNEEHPQLLLDYQGYLSLIGFDPEREANLIECTLRPARFYEWPNIGLTHPDPLIRQSYGLGLIAFWLGVVSLFISIF